MGADVCTKSHWQFRGFGIVRCDAYEIVCSWMICVIRWCACVLLHMEVSPTNVYLQPHGVNVK